MRERGFPADQDNAFMTLIDDWTLGLIEMAECRSRYAGIIRERRHAHRNTMALAVLRNAGDIFRSKNDPNAEPASPDVAQITPVSEDFDP
jgi:hypothetical protein